ncbi:hypothetical protein ABPG74_008760 [Tetrahymena malaccensis]
MNKYSLRFESSSLEQKFQEEVRKVYSKTFLTILKSYIFLVALPCIVISIINFNLSNLIAFSFGFFACIFNYFTSKRFPKYYNILTNSLSFCVPIVLCSQVFFFGYTTGISDIYFLFFFGACGVQIQVTMAFLSANFLMTFSQMVCSIILYYYAFWNNQIYGYKYEFGVFQFFIIYVLYIVQKNRREVFLHQNSEKEWLYIVKKLLSSSIMTIKYDKKNNNINLEMINDQAKSLLMINNEEEFKQFTRKTLIQDRVSDIQNHKQLSELLNDKSDYMTPLHQQTNRFSKNTLENRIITILKQYILSNIKLNSQNKPKKDYQDQNSFNSKQLQNYQFNNDQKKDLDFFQDLCYGIYKKNDEAEDKKLSIKIQAYQHQTDYFCCLVIEEETLQHKIKSLESLNKSHLNNFFSFFIKMGRRLEEVLINIQNGQCVKAIIAQCFNSMNNFKDYAYIQKNQFKLKIDKLWVQTIQLEEIQKQILLKFNNYQKQVEIKVQFINCNSSEVIITYVDKFQQLLINLIENSIQSQLSAFGYYSGQLKSPIRFSQKGRQFTSNSLQFKDNTNKSNQEISQINFDQSQNQAQQYYEKRFINFKESVDKLKQKCSQILKVEQEKQNTDAQNKQIIVTFELLKGESNLSNIFKISVLDNGVGMVQDKLLEILECLGIQNSGSNLNQKCFNYLGWKVNYHIIGNIGPFYNFYIQNTLNKGFVYHFYMYQDINILSNSTLQEQKQFQNNQFTQSLNLSNGQFFHLNNINKLQNEVYQQNNNFDQESLQKYSAYPLLNPNNQFSFSKIFGKCNEQQHNTETQLDQDESTSSFSRKNTLQLFVAQHKDFGYPCSKKLISDLQKN